MLSPLALHGAKLTAASGVLLFLHVLTVFQFVHACVQPPFDRDFPSLAGRSNVGKSWHTGNALPEQQWTRLADAPDGSALSPRLSNPRVAAPAEAPKPVVSKLTGAAVDVPASQPRMADTLQVVHKVLLALLQQCTICFLHVDCCSTQQSTCKDGQTTSGELVWHSRKHPCQILL